MKYVALTIGLSLLTVSPDLLAKHGDKIPGQYIVILKEHDPKFSDRTIQDALRDSGVDEKAEKKQIKAKFKGSFVGFAGELKPSQLVKLKKDSRVKFIEQDEEVYAEPVAANTKGGKKGTSPTPEPEPEPTPTPEPEPTPTPEPEPTPEPTPAPEPSYPSGLNYGSPTGSQPVPWGIARVGGPGQVAAGKAAWIIDSGATPSHPDLNFDITRSKSFISGDTSVIDGYGHGTMVAGIIGAKDNSIGVIGVAPNVPLVALRVFDNVGYGTLTRIYSALNHAFNYAKAGDVINMSLRVNASTMLDDLVRKAAAKGLLIAIAAGNSNVDCTADSPARVNATGVYTVSAMDSSGRMSSWSNYGLPVDFAAPGVNITSTSHNGGYATGNGTSYAAPHVAGILLLHGRVQIDGYVLGDKDSMQDPIAHR